jgi:eukaryotic-like serine/threonine-protein kinase
MKVSRDRWQRIARIYEAAAELDPAARDTFLSEACASDDSLRDEVESLLRHDTADVVLDSPVWATSAPLFDDGSELRPGSVLGPYRIEGPLGAGGMGKVFRAMDTRLDRRVAVKVLPPGGGHEPQMRARFAREAKAIAALTHPHICTLYDVGRHDQIDYLIMEYLEGDTLAARLTRGPLSLEVVLALANQIAGALAHAHRFGIIHRDLKPANIMVTAGGAKLLDFGIAKLRGAAGVSPNSTDAGTLEPARGAATSEPGETDAANVTRDGAILGTVRYMAPEQVRGREMDARGDLFSFGVVLYES